VLSELARIGSRSAGSAQDLAQAQLLCQTRLNEVLAGIWPLRQVHQAAIENAPGWLASVDIEPLESQSLLAIRVTVTQDAAQKSHSAHCTLVRWIRDPQRPLATSSTATGPEPLSVQPPVGQGVGR